MAEDITICKRAGCQYGIEEHEYIDTGDLQAPRMPCNLCSYTGYIFLEPEMARD